MSSKLGVPVDPRLRQRKLTSVSVSCHCFQVLPRGTCSRHLKKVEMIFLNKAFSIDVDYVMTVTAITKLKYKKKEKTQNIAEEQDAENFRHF